MSDRTPKYAVELPEDIRQPIEAEICRRVSSAVSDASERDSQLGVWRDQLQGFGITAGNKDISDASDFYDSISLEAHLTLVAQICGALHRDPKVAVEAFVEEEKENARIIESYLAMETSRSRVDDRLYEMGVDACWSQAVITYAGWYQKTRSVREAGYRKQDDERIYFEEEKEDGVDYEEVPLTEEVTDEGFDIRVVDLADFYMYPANSKSIEQATLVAERMLLTENDLYDGIDDFGYDEDAVEQLCELGPVSDTERQQSEDDQNGVKGADGDDGFYEVFSVYARLPRRIAGGDELLPEQYLQEDFLIVCCPERQIVLKMALSPYKQRPYFAGGIMPMKDTILGLSLMGILEAIQAEANANIQWTIDNNNLTTTPCLKGPKLSGDDLSKMQVKAGAYLGLDDPGSVTPLEWDRAPLRDGLLWQQDLRNRANSLVSAQGQGQLQSKVRKSGEVQAVETQAAAKFGLYLSNFQRTCVAELYRRMIALKLQFGDVDEDGEDFSDSEGHSYALTPRALRGVYNVVAAGSSLTHSPESRIEVGKQKQAIQVQYLQASQALPPKIAKLAWHGARELLFDLGERNPEAWIGDEPEENVGGQPSASPAGPQGPGGAPQPNFNGISSAGGTQ